MSEKPWQIPEKVACNQHLKEFFLLIFSCYEVMSIILSPTLRNDRFGDSKYKILNIICLVFSNTDSNAVTLKIDILHHYREKLARSWFSQSFSSLTFFFCFSFLVNILTFTFLLKRDIGILHCWVFLNFNTSVHACVIYL